MSISFVRFVVGAVLACAVILILRKSFRVTDWKSWALRGIFGAASMALFYAGIHVTSSGRATLFADTYPVFVAVFGFMFFGEKIGPGRIAGVILCIAGSVIVFYDGSSYPVIGNFLCIASAVTGGIAVHFLKRARESHNSFLVYLAPCLFGAVASMWTVPELARAVSLRDMFFLLLVGVLAFAGQILMSFGYRYVSATEGSIIGMSEILFSVMISAALLGEEMTPRFFAGGACVLAGLGVNQLDMVRAAYRHVAHSRRTDR
jgi:drug/metabolite transporter (DMT)-like permease